MPRAWAEHSPLPKVVAALLSGGARLSSLGAPVACTGILPIAGNRARRLPCVAPRVAHPHRPLAFPLVDTRVYMRARRISTLHLHQSLVPAPAPGHLAIPGHAHMRLLNAEQIDERRLAPLAHAPIVSIRLMVAIARSSGAGSTRALAVYVPHGATDPHVSGLGGNRGWCTSARHTAPAHALIANVQRGVGVGA